MALIKCKECGKEISNQAEACVYCGFPLKPKKDSSIKNNFLSIFIYLLFSALILFVIFNDSIPSIVTKYSGNYTIKQFVEWVNSVCLKRFEITDPFTYALAFVLGISFILMFTKVKVAKIIYGILAAGSVLATLALCFMGYKLHIGMYIIVVSLFIMLIYNNNITINEVAKTDFWKSLWPKIKDSKKILNIDFLKRNVVKSTFVIGFIGIVLVSYILISPSSQEIKAPLLFLSEDNSLRLINSNMRNSVEIASTSKDDEVRATISKNRRYFLYFKNNNLYLVDTNDKNYKSHKIMSDVESAYFINDDKNIVILTDDDELYVYDYRDKKRLEKDVISVEGTVKDKIMYVKDDTLYIRSVKNGVDDKKKISGSFSSYNYVMVSKNEKYLLYSINNDDNYDYYKYTIATGKNEKVLTNIASLSGYTENFDSFIYTVHSGENTVEVSKIFTDNYKESDALYEEKDYFLDYIYGYITYEEYSELSELENAVSRRNSVRELLEDDISFGNSYDVYYQSGNDKTKLVSNITSLEKADVENKQIFYSIKNFKNTKKIDIDDVSSYTYNDIIEDYFVYDLMYKKDGFEETKITTLDNSSVVIYAESKNDFYYKFDTDEKSEFYYIKINSGKVKENKLISDNFYSFSYYKYNGKLIFTENYNKDDLTSDLRIVSAGKTIEVAYDVFDSSYLLSYSINDKYLAYYKVTDTDDYIGDYFIYNGKSKKLFEDINYVMPYSEKYMYVYKDCSSDGSCDLYRYQNSKLKLVEYGIYNISLNFTQ